MIGKMAAYIRILTWLLYTQHCLATVFHHDHICNTSYIIPLELGDSGTVSGTTDMEVFHHMESCKLQLLSCDHCHLQLHLVELDFPPCHVNVSDIPRYMTCIEGCSHLTLLEPAYADVTSQYFLGENITADSREYVSMSSSVVLTMCMASHEGHIEPGVFHVEYQVIEKIQYFNGSANGTINNGIIQSPNFPLGYAVQGELYAYVITSIDPGGQIWIVFEDWDLATVSRVYFYEEIHTDTPLAVYFGSSARPILLSPGPSLYVTFHPDVGITSRTHNMGFRLRYTFVEENIPEYKPITDCGENFKYKAGGQIVFPKPGNLDYGYYDCVWAISKISAFDWIFLKINNISGFEGNQNMSLTIRSGPISDSPILDQLDLHDNNNNNNTYENQTKLESSQGFYIRLNGSYSGTQTISLVYAAYNLPTVEGCGRTGEFLCHIGNYCIDHHLVCDGHIHCSDASDEREYCQSTVAPGKTVPVLTCKSHEFLCKDGRRCVPQSAVCDKWLDCQDGSDEYVCTNPKPNVVEKGTTSIACGPVEYMCQTRDQCIPKDQLCDGTFHCQDRSDEMQCALTIQSAPTRKSAWNVVIPMGIALCVVFFVCAVVMCIRNHYKHYHQYRPHHIRRPSHGVRRSRTIRSLTSETPLTLSLSRSTSGITVENPPESPPSYEEAIRHSPDGASAPNVPGVGQVSPRLLSPSGYLTIPSPSMSQEIGNKQLLPTDESHTSSSFNFCQKDMVECPQHPSSKLDTIAGNLPAGLPVRDPKNCRCNLYSDSSSQGTSTVGHASHKEELIFRFPDSCVTCKGQQQRDSVPSQSSPWEQGNCRLRYQSENSGKSSKPLFKRGINTLTDSLIQSEDVSA